MRKLLLTTAAAAASVGLATAAQAATVTFTGNLSADVGDGNSNGPVDGVTDPNLAGEMFTITLDVDETGALEASSVNSATIMIGDVSDPVEIIRVTAIDVPSGSDPAAQDELSFDLVSTGGPLAGNFDIDFTFMNSMLTDSSTFADALDALSSYICAHFLFDFGGFKYSGVLDEGGIVIDPVDPIPLPGAAVFMLSGLAAAGAARARRKTA